jgi:hypothetical protein
VIGRPRCIRSGSGGGRRPGTAPGCGDRRWEERGGAWPEVGDGADGWAPSVREREGARKGTGAGGPAWAESGAGRGGEEGREELGRG